MRKWMRMKKKSSLTLRFWVECYLTWETLLATEKVNIYIFPKLLTFLRVSKIYKRLQLHLSNSIQRKTSFPGSLPNVFLVWKYVSGYNLSKKKIHSLVLQTFLLLSNYILTCELSKNISTTRHRKKNKSLWYFKGSWFSV